MNPTAVPTVRMFGPALSGPPRLVNRDVPLCDEQAYVRAGYKRGSIPEPDEVFPAEVPVKKLELGSEEVSLEEEPQTVEPVEDKSTKPRRSKGQKINAVG